jgi:hypothetical protein
MDQEARQATVKTLDMGIVLALVAMDVIARLLPHAPNFTPVAASALFAGVFLGSRLLALTVPLGAMGLSDSVIGFYDWHVMVAVYVALALPAVLGWFAKSSSRRILVLPLAVVSSVIFFVMTNFAVWMSSGMYPHDVAGLLKCSVAAIPFFQNTLMGDTFWAIALFGTVAIWQAAGSPRNNPRVV